jgi:hypothetical protein
LLALSVPERLKKRYEKFRAHGHYIEKTTAPAEKAEPVVNGSAAPPAVQAA